MAGKFMNLKKIPTSTMALLLIGIIAVGVICTNWSNEGFSGSGGGGGGGSREHF
jgi:hypothetical protein